MKHNFTWKLLDHVDSDILEKLKQFVLTGNYVKSNDFQEYTLTIWNIHRIRGPISDLFASHMSKFCALEGHVGTNIAKMVPGGYVPEHSDYTANTYGKMQDSIIKFQIPVITNPGAGLCWKNDKNFPAEALFLKEGGIYMFDNCRFHSSANFGTQDRYWITSRWNRDFLIDKSLLNSVVNY
jgi:hypothetical protein